LDDIMMAFGVLIGFCWEHPFDLGVLKAAERVENYPEIMQFVGCGFIAAIVLPAHIWYIAPKQFHLIEKKHEELKKIKASEEAEAASSTALLAGGTGAGWTQEGTQWKKGSAGTTSE
jgi:hypothetical protein